MMRVIFLCVNYNSYNALEEYLKSIKCGLENCKSDVEVKVLIGDNSINPRYIDVEKYGYKVRQIICNENTGYFGGVSRAIVQSGVQLCEYDYIIISNVDVKIDVHFFDEINRMRVEENVGCIAPAILSAVTGRDKNPKILHRYSLKKINALRMMYRFPFVFNAYLKYKKITNRPTQVINVSEAKNIYASHGSFMIFTTKFADFLQTLQFPSFMYGEEIFIGEELRKRNLKTLYWPKIKIFDTEHISTGKTKNKVLFKYNYESLTKIKEIYY